MLKCTIANTCQHVCFIMKCWVILSDKSKPSYFYHSTEDSVSSRKKIRGGDCRIILLFSVVTLYHVCTSTCAVRMFVKLLRAVTINFVEKHLKRFLIRYQLHILSCVVRAKKAFIDHVPVLELLVGQESKYSLEIPCLNTQAY